LHCTSTQCTKCGGFSSSLHIVLARVDLPDPAVPAEQSQFINSATHLKHFYEKKNTKKVPDTILNSSYRKYSNHHQQKGLRAGKQQKHNIHHHTELSQIAVRCQKTQREILHRPFIGMHSLTKHTQK